MRHAFTHLLHACLLALVAAATVHANSGGPPVRRSGVPTDDNGTTCTACHATGTSTEGGRVTITADPYRPGVPQVIRVAVAHPEAMRWGFQLTARAASDTNQKAGSFTASADMNATTAVRVRCAATGNPFLDPGTTGCSGGALEFASHSATSTRQGTPQGVSWDVQWTPPANDVGAVIFFASGNAASGSAGNQGDRIYNTQVRIAPLGPPTISQNGVVNAANSPTPSTTIATGAFLSIYGSDLAPGVADWGSSFTNGRAPTTLNNVSVKVNNRDAFVAYVSPGQINAVVPEDTATGTVAVQVTTPVGTSPAINVQKAAVAPAFFT